MSRYIQSCKNVSQNPPMPELGKWQMGHAPLYDFLYQNIQPDYVCEFGISAGNQHVIWNDFWDESVIVGVEKCDNRPLEKPSHKDMNIRSNYLTMDFINWRNWHETLEPLSRQTNSFAMHYNVDCWHTETADLVKDAYGKLDVVIQAADEKVYSWWMLDKVWSDLVPDTGVIIDEGHCCTNIGFSETRFGYNNLSLQASQAQGWLCFDFWPLSRRANNQAITEGYTIGVDSMRSIVGVYTKDIELRNKIQHEFAQYQITNFAHFLRMPTGPIHIESRSEHTSWNTLLQQHQLDHLLNSIEDNTP